MLEDRLPVEIGAEDRQAELLQLTEALSDIADLSDADVRSGAGRSFFDGGVQRNRSMLRDEHAVDAGGVGGAEDCAEIMRVLNFVEQDDERRLVERAGVLENVVDGGIFDWSGDGDDALMILTVDELIEFGARDELDAYFELGGERDNFFDGAVL